jgi:transcription termination factor NusA
MSDIDTDALPDINGMTPKIMKLLIEEGFATPHQIAMANADDVTRIQGVSDNKARQVIYAARDIVGVMWFVLSGWAAGLVLDACKLDKPALAFSFGGIPFHELSHLVA